MIYNVNMRYKIKRLLILSILSSLALTSCSYGEYPYNVFIDSDHNLRVIQYHDYDESDEYYAVDEYYYNEDKYDGEININITIPDSINGLPVKHFGRQASIEILTNNDTKFSHDRHWPNVAPLSLIYFSLVGFSYFDENTTFNINIDIQCDLIDFKIYDLTTYDESREPPLIYFYNNNSYSNEYEKDQTFYYNLYISITEKSTKYYSKDGEVYERNDEGEDKKITANYGRLIVNGNLNPYYDPH